MAEEYTDYEGMRANSHKVLKTVLKIILIALIIFILGVIIVRSCMRVPKKVILYSDQLKAALEKDGDIEIYHQTPHDSINRNADETFQFSVHDTYYIPETHQLQVTVRFNNAVLNDAKEKYGLEKTPDYTCFRYALMFEGDEIISSYSYATATRGNYRFVYLLFDGVELEQYTPVYYKPEDAAVTDTLGNIMAHETDSNGKYILYETDEEGYAKVYARTFVSLEAYYCDDVDISNPLSSLIVFNRIYELEKVTDYQKYIDYDGNYKMTKVTE